MDVLVCSVATYNHPEYSTLLEELLIDFRELVGEHSGENMAEEVWACLETYGLDDGRIIALNMDNAPNNDTLVEHLALKCAVAGIQFDATAARIRCMPHTGHLAAIKVLCCIQFIIHD
ncbi:hypothetical protein B0H10DRAFT_1770695 [Mycena sp. CBHHK59/15]|nr:hypothetical protein B0H10DRAFT_1770695 [Mycena sp. CBHHK59/15]